MQNAILLLKIRNNVDSGSSSVTRRISTYLCRAPSKHTTVFPGEFITVDVPNDFMENEKVVIEARIDSHSQSAGSWPELQVAPVIGGQIQVVNKGNEAILIEKNDNFC